MNPDLLDESYLDTRAQTRRHTEQQFDAFTVGSGTEDDPAIVPEVTVTPDAEKKPEEKPQEIIVPLPEEAAAIQAAQEQTQPKQGLDAILDSLNVPQELTLGALSGKGLERVTAKQFVDEHVPGGVDAFLSKIQEVTKNETLGPMLMTLPVVAVSVLLDPLNAIPGAAPAKAGKAVGQLDDAARLAASYARLQEQGVKLTKKQKGVFDDAWKVLQGERGSVPLGGKAKPPKPEVPPKPVYTFDEAAKIDELNTQFKTQFDAFAADVDVQRRGVRPDVQVRQEASELVQQWNGLLDVPPGTILNDAEVVAARDTFYTQGKAFQEAAKAVTRTNKSPEAITAFAEQFTKTRDSLMQIEGVFAESGRTQRLLRKDLPTMGQEAGEAVVKEAGDFRISDPYIKQLDEFFRGQAELSKINPGAITVDKVAEMVAGMQTPEELAAFTKAMSKPGWWDMAMEVWINGLLSGPQTHATNTLSNAATMLWSIPERAVASAYTRSIKPGESAAMLGGVVESVGDAWRLAWQAFKAEMPVSGLTKIEVPRRAISADALELTGPVGQAVDFLGATVRLPGRFLVAGDEFFKGIAFRAELRAQAYREAFQQVNELGLTGKEAAATVAQIQRRILADPPTSLKEAAQEFAAYTTFTRELGEVGQKVQSLAGTPVGRIILPFVRTPTNIFKYAGERTPFALASRAVREEIAAGGERRALALAKISLGSSTMALIAGMAANGAVTGNGPKDPALRQMMRNTGWQPNSFKIGDTYYSYSRLEPIGSLFGMAADAASIMGQLDQQDAEEVAAALTVAFARNASSKTFIKGMAETLTALTSQDVGVVENFLEKMVPTAIPFSSLVRQTARVVDPVMREADTILEAVQARVPGWSKDLPPRRNLWGEPILLEGGLGPDLISPLYTSTQKVDQVSEELVRLELSIPLPSKQVEGVPLTPKEYDRYVELAGNATQINGKGLKDQLAAVMQSDLYQRASDGPDGGKAVLIRGWVSEYRDKAKRELAQEQPELQAQFDTMRQIQKQRFNAAPGGLTR